MQVKKNNLTLSEKIIVLAIFLAPFDTLNLRFIYITFSDLLFICAGLVVIIEKLLAGQYYIKSKRLYLILTWLLGVTVLVIGYLFSMLMSSNALIKEAVSLILQYFFVFSFIPLVLLKINKKNYRIFLKSYIYGMFFMILIGLALLYFAPDMYQYLINKELLIGTRRFGSFIGTNSLAKTIAMCFPILFLLINIGNLSKKESFFIFIIYIIGLVETASIGGTLATLMAIFLSFIFVSNITTQRKVLVVFLAILCVSIPLFLTGIIEFDFFTSRVMDTFFSGNLEGSGSYSMKMSLMKDALKIITENPLWGLGPGGFYDNSIYQQTVHNSYLLLWAEGGILSLIGFLIIVYSIIRYIVYYWKTKSTRTNSNLALVIVAILLFNLITGTQLYQRYRIIPIILMLFSIQFPIKKIGETSGSEEL